MKILQIGGGATRIPPSTGGGVEAFVFNLSKKLSQLGHEVILVDRKYSPPDPAVEHIDGVDIIRLKAARLNSLGFAVSFVLSQVFFALRVNRYLKEITDCDIVHVHHSVLGFVLCIANKEIRKKLVYTSHTVRRDKASATFGDRLAIALENFLVKRVRKFLVLNEMNRKKVIDQTGIIPEDVFLVPIGVDVNQYNPNLDSDDVRQRYGFDGKTNILFVGRISPEKGVEYLVKAADILVNKQGNTELRFLLVGPARQFDAKNGAKSKYLSNIAGLVESSGLQDTIRITGAVPIDDLKKLYSASDVFVLPSIFDLDPQVLLEAMAMGKPVIGTRVGAIPWRIADGESGFVIDPASENQIAEKIKYLIDSPDERKRMGDNGRKIVCEEYSAEKTAERVIEVYQSIKR